MPADDFFNEKEKAKTAKYKMLLEEKHNAALKELVNNKQFRFYMAELLGYCKTFENAFNEKGNVAAFNNGMQAVGQKIFNDIMLVSPKTYLMMCEEENEVLALKDQIKGE